MLRAQPAIKLCASLAIALALAAPASAVSIHWHPAMRIEPLRNGGFSAISCPNNRLCVAVDQSGFAVTTTNPTGGSKAWSSTVKIDRGGTLTGISCPTTRFCVAVDAAGNALVSTRPTGGAKAWKRFKIDTTTAPGASTSDLAPVGLSGISCASPSLCVAVDAANPANVLTSTNPSGGGRAWTMVKKVASVLTAVSCPSVTLCTVVGAGEYISVDPGSPTGVWKQAGTPPNGAADSAVTCQAIGMCLSAGFGNSSAGYVNVATDPKAGSAWTLTQVQSNPPNPNAGNLDGIGCTANGLCAAVDSADNAFVSTDQTHATWSAQTGIGPSGATPVSSAISCGSTVCVVVDSLGYAIVGTAH